jgi:hypothetical protein
MERVYVGFGGRSPEAQFHPRGPRAARDAGETCRTRQPKAPGNPKITGRFKWSRRESNPRAGCRSHQMYPVATRSAALDPVASAHLAIPPPRPPPDPRRHAHARADPQRLGRSPRSLPPTTSTAATRRPHRRLPAPRPYRHAPLPARPAPPRDLPRRRHSGRSRRTAPVFLREPAPVSACHAFALQSWLWKLSLEAATT